MKIKSDNYENAVTGMGMPGMGMPGGAEGPSMTKMKPKLCGHANDSLSTKAAMITIIGR